MKAPDPGQPGVEQIGGVEHRRLKGKYRPELISTQYSISKPPPIRLVSATKNIGVSQLSSFFVFVFPIIKPVAFF